MSRRTISDYICYHFHPNMTLGFFKCPSTLKSHEANAHQAGENDCAKEIIQYINMSVKIFDNFRTLFVGQDRVGKRGEVTGYYYSISMGRFTQISHLVLFCQAINANALNFVWKFSTVTGIGSRLGIGTVRQAGRQAALLKITSQILGQDKRAADPPA